MPVACQPAGGSKEAEVQSVATAFGPMASPSAMRELRIEMCSSITFFRLLMLRPIDFLLLPDSL